MEILELTEMERKFLHMIRTKPLEEIIAALENAGLDEASVAELKTILSE